MTSQNFEVSGVFSLFQSAVSAKLRFPKIRLQTPSGRVVVLKLAGDRSKHPGHVQITDDRPFGENTYYGRIDPRGQLFSTADLNSEVFALLARLASNPAAVASEYGLLTGNCCFCQRKLTDPQSTAVGYGEICANHFGMPYGKDFSGHKTVSESVTDSLLRPFEQASDVLPAVQSATNNPSESAIQLADIPTTGSTSDSFSELLARWSN